MPLVGGGGVGTDSTGSTERGHRCHRRRAGQKSSQTSLRSLSLIPKAMESQNTVLGQGMQ